MVSLGLWNGGGSRLMLELIDRRKVRPSDNRGRLLTVVFRKLCYTFREVAFLGDSADFNRFYVVLVATVVFYGAIHKLVARLREGRKHRKMIQLGCFGAGRRKQ